MTLENVISEIGKTVFEFKEGGYGKEGDAFLFHCIKVFLKMVEQQGNIYLESETSHFTTRVANIPCYSYNEREWGYFLGKKRTNNAKTELPYEYKARVYIEEVLKILKKIQASPETEISTLIDRYERSILKEQKFVNNFSQKLAKISPSEREAKLKCYEELFQNQLEAPRKGIPPITLNITCLSLCGICHILDTTKPEVMALLPYLLTAYMVNERRERLVDVFIEEGVTKVGKKKFFGKEDFFGFRVRDVAFENITPPEIKMLNNKSFEKCFKIDVDIINQQEFLNKSQISNPLIKSKIQALEEELVSVQLRARKKQVEYLFYVWCKAIYEAQETLGIPAGDGIDMKSCLELMYFFIAKNKNCVPEPEFFLEFPSSQEEYNDLISQVKRNIEFCIMDEKSNLVEDDKRNIVPRNLLDTIYCVKSSKTREQVYFCPYFKRRALESSHFKALEEKEKKIMPKYTRGSIFTGEQLDVEFPVKLEIFITHKKSRKITLMPVVNLTQTRLKKLEELKKRAKKLDVFEGVVAKCSVIELFFCNAEERKNEALLRPAQSDNAERSYNGFGDEEDGWNDWRQKSLPDRFKLPQNYMSSDVKTISILLYEDLDEDSETAILNELENDFCKFPPTIINVLDYGMVEIIFVPVDKEGASLLPD